MEQLPLLLHILFDKMRHSRISNNTGSSLVQDSMSAKKSAITGGLSCVYIRNKKKQNWFR